MPHVVTENCINCKYTDCAAVCPTQAFREGRNMVVIDPEACIDCTACADACPTEAIYQDDRLPLGRERFVELNARLAKVWPLIDEQRTCLGHLSDGRSRLELLDERPGG